MSCSSFTVLIKAKYTSEIEVLIMQNSPFQFNSKKIYHIIGLLCDGPLTCLQEQFADT